MRNVFTIEKPRKKILAFVTQGKHTSGTLMKQIDFRRPKIIEEFKQEGNINIKDVLHYDNYIFVVYKKHYNTVVSRKKFEELLIDVAGELNQYSMKTTNDDLPQFKELIEKYIPTIEFRETGQWGVFD